MPEAVTLDTAFQRPIPVRLWNILRKGSRQPALDPDSLISKARKKTGLQDLGSDFDITPFSVLHKAIEEEAHLNAFGRFMLSQKLINQIINRLWANHWFNKFPEILEQELLPIYMISGLQRTGTTRLQRLLSGQDGARPLLAWEALSPAPLGNKDERRKRMKSTRTNEKAVKYIAPGFHAIHPIHYDAPEEDVLLLDLTFMSTTSEAILHVPSYANWIEENDQKPAYEYELKLLKLLQWQKGGSYWVLKSPHHLEFAEEATEVFPNLKFIWAHRDPSVCIPSFLSMVYHSRAMFSDNVTIDDVRDHWLRKTKRMVRKGIEFAPADTCHLSYHTITRDPHKTVATVLGKPGIDVKRDKYSSRHRYSLEDFDLSSEIIQQEFEEYYRFVNSKGLKLNDED